MNKAHEPFQSSTRPDFEWALPYPSRRQPIMSRNVVAISKPLAKQAGIAMLHAGGNAVDAALATAIALTICEPCSNGLGSDLFAIVWDGSELVGLNASGRAPAAWSPSRYAGQGVMPRAGWATVTIPGAVSGWIALSKRFGKLPFADLFGPAIRYARDGYAVSPVVAENGRRRCPSSATFPDLRTIFCRGVARRQQASSSPRPRWPRPWKKSRARPANRSIAPSWRRRWSRTRASTTAVIASPTSRHTAATGCCPWRTITTATPSTRFLPTARASPR